MFYSDLYHKFRGLSLEQLSLSNIQEVASTVIFDGAMAVKNTSLVYAVAALVAHKTKEDNFIEFLESGKLPNLKLNLKEMNFMKTALDTALQEIKEFSTEHEEKAFRILARLNAVRRNSAGKLVLTDEETTRVTQIIAA